ncbi:MAG TPA: hypothetical protein VNY52_02980 [Solirubrobacteraceae bacterium]|nr:hypothetical protein [Solirubrobacteraceae bacterium]
MASITFGDELGVPRTRMTTYACGAPCTLSTTVSPARLSVFRSPITGTIVRWRIETDAESVAQKVRLRVLAPTAMDGFTGAEDEEFTGVGSSAAVPVPTIAGTFTFPTRVPIVAGDFIGLDTEGKALGAVAVEEESVRVFDPPLGDFGPARTGAHEDYALLVNADVIPAPRIMRLRRCRSVRHRRVRQCRRGRRREAPSATERAWSLAPRAPWRPAAVW